MSVRVLFFASLRERLGHARAEIEIGSGATVEDVWTRAVPGERFDPTQVLAAVNQAMVGGDEPVADGDEVAFFPPVTGG